MTKNAEIADVLDRAADHIDRVGWVQGDWYEQVPGRDPKDCSVCADGALCVAVYGDPLGQDCETNALYGQAHVALQRRLGRHVLLWNDESGRTQDDVTTLLRETASELRKA